MPDASRWSKMTPEQKAAQRQRINEWNRRQPPEYHTKRYRRDAVNRGAERLLLSQTKYRANKAGIPFNLELSDIVIPEYCPVLGLKLEKGKGRINPNSPSIDRIIPSLGYVKGNILIISNRANAIKQNATPEEILKVGLFFESLLKERQLAA